MRKILLVAFDVTYMSEAEAGNLAFAASVQGEGGDDYPGAESVEDKIVEADDIAQVFGAVEVGLGH